MSSSTLFLVAAELEARLLFGDEFPTLPGVRVVGVGRPGDTGAAEAIEETGAERIINVGFAGSLVAHAEAGSVHVVSRWTDLAPSPASAALADELLDLLRNAECSPQASIATTVDSPVADASTRAKLAATGADLVEMEGARWARVAAGCELPFVSVRVISDQADLDLPGMRHHLLTSSGGVNWPAWWRAARRPAGSIAHHYRAILQARGEWRDAVRSLRNVGRALAPLR